MRCNECNKFVGVDADDEPGLNLDLSDEGVVTGSCSIVNNCDQCGTELQTAEFDVELDLSEAVKKHKTDKHSKKNETPMELELSEEAGERTDRFGKGRRAAHFYGASVNLAISCLACKEEITSGTWSDEIQSSAMDESQ